MVCFISMGTFYLVWSVLKHDNVLRDQDISSVLISIVWWYRDFRFSPFIITRSMLFGFVNLVSNFPEILLSHNHIYIFKFALLIFSILFSVFFLFCLFLPTVFSDSDLNVFYGLGILGMVARTSAKEYTITFFDPCMLFWSRFRDVNLSENSALTLPFLSKRCYIKLSFVIYLNKMSYFVDTCC